MFSTSFGRSNVLGTVASFDVSAPFAERSLIRCSNEQRRGRKELRSILLKEAHRGCGHCDNQIGIVTGKESTNVAYQRSFLGRLSSSRKRPATALQGSKSGPNECNRGTRRGSAKPGRRPARPALLVVGAQLAGED
jgi:hypothetical protein